MSIGGELIILLKEIDYKSKKELLDKLRDMRTELKTYPKNERRLIKPLLNVALQQAYYTSEYDLLKVKRHITKRKNVYGRSRANEVEENIKS